MSLYFKYFRKILSQSFSFFCANSFWLAALSLIIVGPVFVIDFFFWGNDILIQSLIDSLTVKGLIALGYFINVVLFIVLIFFYTAFITFIDNAAYGVKKADIFFAVKFAYGKLWRVLITVLQYLFKVALWSLLLIIPGIYKAVVLSFAPIISIVDDRNDIFQVSEGMVKPKFWLYIRMILSLLAVTIAVTFPGIMLVDTFNVFAIERFFPTAAIVINYLLYLAVFWVLMFMLNFFYFLYKNWDGREK